MGMFGRGGDLARWSQAHVGAVPSPVNVSLGALVDALGGTADMVNQYAVNPALQALGQVSGTRQYQFPVGAVQRAVPQPKSMFGQAGRAAMAMAIPIPGGQEANGARLAEEAAQTMRNLKWGETAQDRLIRSQNVLAQHGGVHPEALAVNNQARAELGHPPADTSRTVAYPQPQLTGDSFWAQPTSRLAGADDPRMISTRRPSPAGAKKYGNPDQQLLIQSGDAMRLTPDAWAGNMAQIKELPFMSGVNLRNPDKIAAEATRRGADNLKAIIGSMDPAKVEAARHWYPVAGDLSAATAARTGLPPEAGAGIYAVTSPQTMWDINVGKGDRLMEMGHDGWDSSPAERAAAQRWVAQRLDSRNPGAVAGEGHDYAARIMATPMEELTDPSDRYAKVVLTDAVRNNPMVPKIGVDGSYGAPTYPITWGSGVEINKALNILGDPSMPTIAAQMRGGGKVPSFYNNIIAPYSDAGIATIDTHSAGAASLFPGGGKDPVVYRAMGLSAPKGGEPTAMSSDSTGAKGHYGLFQDMHQLAGDELGMLPREVQSATWEGVRDLWGQSGKTPQLKSDITDIWRTSPNPDAARAAIFDRLGQPLPTSYGWTPGS